MQSPDLMQMCLEKFVVKMALRPTLTSIKEIPKTGKKVNTLDYQVYKERFSIEQLNAWGDGYKTLAVRHETSAINGVQLHYLAFFLIFLKKHFKFKICF